MTGHKAELDWIIALRRRPASYSNRHPDGGTSTFEIICPMCGDDPGLDHRQASAELHRIRGSYTLRAGITAFLKHQEFHDRAENAEHGPGGGPGVRVPLETAAPEDTMPDLADYIVNGLFSVGMNLESACSIVGDGPAGDRIAAATGKVDRLIREVRHHVFAEDIQQRSE